jgi:hypothetical protein
LPKHTRLSNPNSPRPKELYGKLKQKKLLSTSLCVSQLEGGGGVDGCVVVQWFKM